MSISYKVKNNMDKVCVALEMNDFIWQTNYPESEEVCQLMRDLDYPILGCDESEIKSIDDDDFMFIEVPIQYVADYLHKDIEETVYFLENEYIAEDFDGFIEFLRTRDSNFDIEKAFVNEVQNGEEEIKHILETLQEMKIKDGSDTFLVIDDDDPQFEEDYINVYVWDTTNVRSLMDSDHIDYLEDLFGDASNDFCEIDFYVDFYPDTNNVEMSVVLKYDEEDEKRVKEIMSNYDKFDWETDKISLTDDEKKLISKEVKEWLEDRDLINEFYEYKKDDMDR